MTRRLACSMNHLVIAALINACAFILCACGNDEAKTQLTETPQISDCGGFAQKGRADNGPPTSYCDAEVLTWSYDAASRTLSFQDERVYLNCCGDHSLRSSLESGKLVLRQTDAPDPRGGRCGCMCVFDFNTSVSPIVGATIEVEIVRDVTDDTQAAKQMYSATLDLSQGAGSAILDTTDVGDFCHEAE